MAYGHVERNRAAVQPITWEPVGTGIPQRLPGCGGEHLLGRFAPGEEDGGRRHQKTRTDSHGCAEFGGSRVAIAPGETRSSR
jgi:hypothetical protein